MEFFYWFPQFGHFFQLPLPTRGNSARRKRTKMTMSSRVILSVFLDSDFWDDCLLNLAPFNSAYIQELHYQHYLHLLLSPHLVHGVDEPPCEHSQDHAGQQLEQEAVEPHVEAEQELTHLRIFKLEGDKTYHKQFKQSASSTSRTITISQRGEATKTKPSISSI